MSSLPIFALGALVQLIDILAQPYQSAVVVTDLVKTITAYFYLLINFAALVHANCQSVVIVSDLDKNITAVS